MKLIVPAFLILLATFNPSQAEDRTRAVQEELRRRNVYFGEINGRGSEELSTALKRYQSRKGFTATGDTDPSTLRSLGLLPRQAGEAPPKELEWPDEPVLRSDTVIDVAAAATEIAQESGVAVASIAPAADLESASRRTVSRSSSRTARNEGQTASAERRGRSGSAEVDLEAQTVEPKEMMKFVREYLDAVSRNDLARELAFYSDRVNYYNSGTIDRRIIERGLRNYYKRWPKRKHRMVDVLSYRKDAERGEIHLAFRTRLYLKNDRHRVEGETQNHVVISAATEDPRIISISEERIRG